jgi:membrane-bound lytic murein transglycosylase A
VLPLSPLFRPAAFADLSGWAADDHALAFEAFRRSAAQVRVKPYKTGSLGVALDAFAAAHAAALAFPAGTVSAAEARAFFERHFVPALIDVRDGFVTGFYEPDAEASPVRTDEHVVPILSRPNDLLELTEDNRPASIDPSFAYGRAAPGGIVEYFDRAAIDAGALQGRGLELAWLRDKVDAFFIHVQGAARLMMTDGTVKRITYAAKTGHPFRGIGRHLADIGEIPLADVTMQSIRAWLAAHPGRIDDVLHHNRSFIFFREAPVDDPALGPIAAAKVQLTPGRSMAVDRLLHTFGTPFFVDSPSLTAFDGRPFSRLMIAQDTGTAIVGPSRGDLFSGSGSAAGEVAGVIRNAATFHVLLPNALVGGAAP